MSHELDLDSKSISGGVRRKRRLAAQPHLPPQIVAVASARRQFSLGTGDFGRETQRLGLQRIDLRD